MKNNDILNNLNPEQKKAVSYTSGSVLVLAGAGSGKTKVLATRIVWVIRNQNIDFNQIFAVTFTNKAAKEMVHRVSSLLNRDINGMWIGTFHSLALRMLKKHYVVANLPQYFQILGASEQLSIIKKIIKNANLDEEKYPAQELQKFINSQKEQCLRSSKVLSDNFRQQHWIQVYTEYEKYCNSNGVVDFTELLLRSYELLRNNPDILQYYQDQFVHILIDEFQDTNYLQYLWLRLLDSRKNYFFAVGDDDQSIYSFRGAKVLNMQHFVQDFKVAEIVRLEQNYRSTSVILQAANAVIKNNQNRIGKSLWTSNQDEEKIYLYEGYTEDDEAYFVTEEIMALQENQVNLSDIAILYRSNAQSRVFEHFFYNHKISYKVYGGLRFFDRQEIKYILCYLRLLLNENDNEAFLKVVNFPPRKIGAKAIENLQNTALNQGVSLFEAISLLEGRSRLVLANFEQIILALKTKSKIMNLAEIIRYIVEQCKIEDYYRDDKHSGNERIENLNELVNSVLNYQSLDDKEVIASFLTHAVLESSDNQAEVAENSVQLMTMHASKGLEFKIVFVVGLEDGLFPHANSMDDKNNLEEERRLMYVAITRAREKLYLLRACSRLIWGKRDCMPMSRFVTEIPANLVHYISNSCSTKISNTDNYSYYENNFREEDLKDNNYSKMSSVDSVIEHKIGDMIWHEKFGNGKIIQLNIGGSKRVAEIFFVGVGKKTLDLNIAKIVKV